MPSSTLPFLLAVILLAGCAARVTPPGVEIETAGPLVVEVKKPGDGKRFCPPGHRKQGRC